MFKVGIIGPGTVGKAIGAYYKKRNYKVKYFDKDDKITKCTFYFICVPTPVENTDREIHNVMERLPEMAKVIIKSTLEPGTVRELKRCYPYMEITHSPEFLSDKTAEGDFENELPINVGSEEGELIKLATNWYYASKVTFFNQVYDICEKRGLDYEAVRKHLVSNWRIANSHSEIWHKGYRGYGGKCLKKDVKILKRYMEELDVEIKTIQEMIKYNNKIKKDGDGNSN